MSKPSFPQYKYDASQVKTFKSSGQASAKSPIFFLLIWISLNIVLEEIKQRKLYKRSKISPWLHELSSKSSYLLSKEVKPITTPAYLWILSIFLMQGHCQQVITGWDAVPLKLHRWQQERTRISFAAVPWLSDVWMTALQCTDIDCGALLGVNIKQWRKTAGKNMLNLWDFQH